MKIFLSKKKKIISDNDPCNLYLYDRDDFYRDGLDHAFDHEIFRAIFSWTRCVHDFGFDFVLIVLDRIHLFDHNDLDSLCSKDVEIRRCSFKQID